MGKGGQKQQVYSNEDRLLLEKIKKAKISLDGDLRDFKKLLEDELYEEDKNKKLKEYEDSLNQQDSELKNEIKELQEQKDSLISKYEELKKHEIDEAKEKASEIINNARENTRKERDKFLQDKEDLKKEKDELEKEKEEFAQEKENLKNEQRNLRNDKEQLEIDQDLLKDNQEQVKKLKEIYKNSNPDALELLNKRLEMKTKNEEQLLKDFQDLQQKYNVLNRLRISTEGINPLQLQEDYNQLLEKNTELENKLNQYSEYKLMEMERAYQQEDEYKEIIDNQGKQIKELNANLLRVNNLTLQYEQQQSQLELLRTLNNHLKTELDNTKFMLESSVGEVCPALTRIDSRVIKDDNNRHANQRNLSLQELVHHVVNFAAAEQLYYSENDIKAFIAGLASPSHLSILQGISGTGKTSLPKVFMKAIMGEIDIVPVESSWRDRNELLGYYNDFSKKFTAKEFTEDLYKAGADEFKDVPYFIVLDEMNLSRIEYYFADFLSVMENKNHDDWKVKLVDTDLRQLPSEISDEVMDFIKKDVEKRQKDILALIYKIYDRTDNNPKAIIQKENSHILDEQKGRRISQEDKQSIINYLSELKLPSTLKQKNIIGGPQRLINGNSIIIPKNVWFIGTANRDESTFEISDKVYDRAQVLNFNERAKKAKDIDTEPVFVSYSTINSNFEKAKQDNPFDSGSYTLLIEIENILKEGFKISFGNRIQSQMDIFVSIYVSASGKTIEDKDCINEALDYQIANKVLRKLEYEEITHNNNEYFNNLLSIFTENHMKKSREYMEWKMRGE